MQVLAVYSMKGGVGKTAAAINLAAEAAAEGHRVLLWDLDPQAASTFYLRVKPERGGARKVLRGRADLDALIKASDFDGLHLLPARFSFRNADSLLSEDRRPHARFKRLLTPLEAAYDLLIFDCAPGLSLMSECVLNASGVTLIPTIPTPLSVRTVQLLARHLADSAVPQPFLFWSMVERRKQLHRAFIGESESLPFPILGTRIPYATHVEKMGVYRAPLRTFAARSDAGHAYAALWEEVRGLLPSR
ncbi:MAG: ParA family protein [Pseudomonadota bacterium]